VAEMEVGRGGVEAGLDAERASGLAGFFETGAQVFEWDDLGGTFGEERELVFYGRETLHLVLSIKTGCRVVGLTPYSAPEE